MRLALIGQPNSGKSTLFNAVAGYRSISANFPGVTVEYISSTTRIDGQVVELIDLPGVYSLTAFSAAERATRDFLLREEIDAFIHVVDASMLARGLELTLRFLEYGVPLILCLNMMDDARRKGIHIDRNKISNALDVPVVETIATQGVGIKTLLLEACALCKKHQSRSQIIAGHKDVEDVIAELCGQIGNDNPMITRFPERFVAIKLLEEDERISALVSPADLHAASFSRRLLEQTHGKEADEVIHAERHALAMSISEKVTTISRPERDFRDSLDRILMHPLWGYVLLLLILYFFFTIIFSGGSYLEKILTGLFSNAALFLQTRLPDAPLYVAIANGLLQGIAGGVTLVLPYLIPFLIGLALLEDAGYLPRVAFLMDGLMHRIGLHGTSLLPAVLGYGCSVPAVMATRILQAPRDRIIAAVLSTLVPCSARTIVILGLVGYYLGPAWAFGLYGFNIVLVALTGKLLSKLMPQLTPGMILEIPRYQIPAPSTILKKTWFRIRDFMVIAWPLLILGSCVLALGELYGMNSALDRVLSPLTVKILGLPVVVGTTLILGVLRKELSLLMLVQALGTSHISSVLSHQQILVFTVFVMFYTPCIATIGILAREIGAKVTAYTILYTLLLATLTAAVVRALFLLV